MKRFMFIYIY